MSTAITSAPAKTNFPFDIPPDGLLPASPDITTKMIGISKTGVLHFYTETAQGDKADSALDAIAGLILDIQLTQRGATSKFGLRDYLDIRLQSPTPLLHYVLSLPAKPYTHPTTNQLQHPWSVRSLLGALITLDLQDLAVKLEAKRGTDATFIQVSLDPLGEQRVTAPAIGPSRQDLEEAIDICRRSLGLEPQFL